MQHTVKLCTPTIGLLITSLTIPKNLWFKTTKCLGEEIPDIYQSYICRQ